MKPLSSFVCILLITVDHRLLLRPGGQPIAQFTHFPNFLEIHLNLSSGDNLQLFHKVQHCVQYHIKDITDWTVLEIDLSNYARNV